MQEKINKQLSLTGNMLKVIAIIAMTIDHLAWMGIETYTQAESVSQILLHMVGRLTAPIMIFFVAEGYHHTHDYYRYLKRMAILALISHFAFCYFNMSSFNPFKNLIFNSTSIAWPLMWGLIFLKVWDSTKFKTWIKVLITIIGCILTCTADWSCAATIAILLIGRNHGKFHRQMLYLMFSVSMYAVAFFIVHSHIYGILHLACWGTVPLLALYNGKRGDCKWLGKFFYWYYPAHLAAIGLIYRLFFLRG